MIKRIYKTIYETRLASFPAMGSPADAAKRLSQVVRPSVFHTLFKQAVVGKVSVDKAVLSRHRPWINNSFKPIFTGQFNHRNGHTVLNGAFSMHWFPKIFISIWFGLLIAICVLSLTVGIVEDLDKGSSVWDGIVAGLGISAVAAGIALLGYGLLLFGKRISRGDVEYISSVIQEAFSEKS